MIKPINFYQWLARTGQNDIDCYQPCVTCDGKGIIEEEDEETGYQIRCEPCGGTGNALYQEYLRQVEEDKKLLNAWICRNLLLREP